MKFYSHNDYLNPYRFAMESRYYLNIHRDSQQGKTTTVPLFQVSRKKEKINNRELKNYADPPKDEPPNSRNKSYCKTTSKKYELAPNLLYITKNENYLNEPVKKSIGAEFVAYVNI